MSYSTASLKTPYINRANNFNHVILFFSIARKIVGRLLLRTKCLSLMTGPKRRDDIWLSINIVPRQRKTCKPLAEWFGGDYEAILAYVEK